LDVKGNLYFLPIKNNVEMAQIRRDTMEAQKLGNKKGKSILPQEDNDEDEGIITFERNNVHGSDIEFGGP